MKLEKKKIFIRAKPIFLLASIIFSIGFIILILTILNILKYEMSQYVLFTISVLLVCLGVCIPILHKWKVVELEQPSPDIDLRYLLIGMIIATIWLILAFFAVLLRV